MGTGDARGHANYGDIVAVCDVDRNHMERAKNDEKIGQGKADGYEDYRKVLDRDDIDVVSIVTCDHWHVKIAIEALQAGKHVFCQKPLTLTFGRKSTHSQRVQAISRSDFHSRNPAAGFKEALPPSRQHGSKGLAWGCPHRDLQHRWR